MSNEPTDPKRPSKPPVGRFGRLARLGALAPRAGSLALAGLKRRLQGDELTEEQQTKARDKLLVEAKKTAEAMLKTLGEMKGLPLKLGQMASYIDGLAPPGYEEKFHSVLKQLTVTTNALARIDVVLRAIPTELDAARSPAPGYPAHVLPMRGA